VTTDVKRTVFLLTVALLTLVLGVTITKVRRATYGFLIESSPTEVSSQSAFVVSVPGTAPATPLPDNEVDPLEATYIDGDKLSYAGYDVERVTDSSEHESWAIIKKNGRTIVRLGNGGLGKDSTKFGLFRLLRRETEQLVIMQYTGGAHCCWVYKIYDFQPQLHLIFDDESYGDSLGYELHPVDIDGDGQYELTQAVMTFDYFHMSHASSVFPAAVFAYNDKAGKYLPANKKFSSYLLGDVENNLRRLESAKANLDHKALAPSEQYLSAVLCVFLDRVYAGREADGWRFFNVEYRESDRNEIKGDLEKAFRSDPIYRSIYLR